MYWCETISGYSFDVLAKLPSLKHLNISGCERIIDWKFSQLEPLRLKTLEMAHVYEICDITPIRNMPLIELDISGCLNALDIRCLSEIKTLEKLNLSETYLGNNSLKVLSKLPMKELRLSNCTYITDDGLHHLSSLPLTYLCLYNCNITDKGLSHLSEMKIEILILDGCPISNKGLQHLSKLPLKVIDLSNTHVDKEGIAHLQSNPRVIRED
jgi:hypothetical protein